MLEVEGEKQPYLRWCSTVPSGSSCPQSRSRSRGSSLWCTSTRFPGKSPKRRSWGCRRRRRWPPRSRRLPSSRAGERFGSRVKAGGGSESSATWGLSSVQPVLQTLRRSLRDARGKQKKKKTDNSVVLWFSKSLPVEVLIKIRRMEINLTLSEWIESQSCTRMITASLGSCSFLSGRDLNLFGRRTHLRTT